jgi:hypothetical protein
MRLVVFFRLLLPSTRFFCGGSDFLNASGGTRSRTVGLWAWRISVHPDGAAALPGCLEGLNAALEQYHAAVVGLATLLRVGRAAQLTSQANRFRQRQGRAFKNAPDLVCPRPPDGAARK